MRHVLWIGGPPASGKTTVATRIARRHGLRWYNADTRTWAHRDRAISEGSAAAIRWEAMSPEERWTVPPAELLELSLHRERGPMVVDDVRALPRSPLVVAEGSTLPAGGVDTSRAVWLLPTRQFREERIAQRRLKGAHLDLLLLLTETIEREAAAGGVPILRVDASDTVDATIAEVERLFAGALAEGPRAQTAGERRSLLREANESVVAQVRGYFARPWAEGDADEVVRAFLCECGDPSCDLSVDVPVGVAAAEPILAEHA